MKGAAYEYLVTSLVQRLVQDTRLASFKIGNGRKNRIFGASGYGHQIDVSISGPSFLCLIEAKHWNKPIGVDSILVLASRIADIQAKIPATKIHASIVSTRKETRGAAQLAPHFGISADVVSNQREFAVRIAEQVFIGFEERLTATSWMDAEVIRKK
ncbi:MAG: hypothetical protein PHR30_11310 [Gallionellaceae bacterium]|nr:hypothetical protein [Gallionellaceae bacterium]MDD5365919.1 hypothetical protein [Gallionellaceae bacterium]